MPRRTAPPALLVVIALIVAIAVVIVPAVDARPKDKNGGNKDAVVTDEVVVEDTTDTETAAQDTTLNSNEPTLLDLDADGDYIPDAMDNCPGAQNPDQADSDRDGVGDACPVYSDYDGDGVSDKEDNCPNIATTDFADRDGDGIGDPCDKSPDGVEPEPDWPEYGTETNTETLDAPPVESGAGEDGRTFERTGSNRSRERSRTTKESATITTGNDAATEDTSPAEDVWVDESWEGEGGEGDVITEGPDAVPYEPSGRDNPRRNEDLIAEAAASGELYAEPLPPPEAQRAWDEEAASVGEWQTVIRIDAGAVENDAGAEARQAAAENGAVNGRNRNKDRVKKRDQARGWMRAQLLLQDDRDATGGEEPPDALDGAPPEPRSDSSRSSETVSPVPIENGLLASDGAAIEAPASAGTPSEPRERNRKKRATGSQAPSGRTIEARGSDVEAEDDNLPAEETDAAPTARDKDSGGKDGSRRNGSSRAVAATVSSQRTRQDDGQADSGDAESTRAGGNKGASSGKGNNGNAKQAKQRERQKARQARSESRDQGIRQGWDADEYFDGGLAVDLSDVGTIAGTDEEALYLTQRAGSGTGKRRGFTYAIPVERDGLYRVRLYFAETESGQEGSRVFSISAEGETLVDDLDVLAEAGPMTALVKQADLEVMDGELNLLFNASAGAPMVAAFEVLEPAD